MKRLSLLSIMLIAVFKMASAQCTPSAPTGIPGFCPPASAFPCIERGQSFYEVIQVENMGDVNGIQVNSMRFDSITNLPPGISFSMNPSNRILSGGETGCIELTGTTSSSAGDYTLGIFVTINITGIGNINGELTEIMNNLISLGFIDTNTTDVPYGPYYVRVNEQGAPCLINGFCGDNYNTISGRVFYDINGNGIMDGSDNPMRGIRIDFSPVSFAQYTGNTGYYSIPLGAGTYDVSASIPPYFTRTTPVSSYHITFIGAHEDSLNNDFGLTANTVVNDVSISLTSSFARPGFASSHWIDYQNTGTSVQSGTITYTYDPQLQFQSSSETPATQNANVITWDFSGLYPGEGRSIYVVQRIPVSAVFGDTLSSYVNIASAYNDTTPSDNADSTLQEVRGSLDPNDKQVSPNDVKNGVHPDKMLTYTVRFQNTGTDTAFTIVVRDTLDNNIDASSFKTIASSNDYDFELEGNKYAIWTFNNILLPDSGTNEPLSHGFVKYAVGLKSNVPDQALVHNSASIYFDFNAAVKTNTVESRVDFNSGIRTPEIIQSSLFPNPASDAFTLVLSRNITDYEVQILDISGRLIQSTTHLSGNKVLLDASALENGIYFYRVVSDNVAISKGKLVVMK